MITHTIVIDTDTGLLIACAKNGDQADLDKDMMKYLTYYPERVDHTFLIGEIIKDTMKEARVSVKHGELLWTKEFLHRHKSIS